MSVRREDWGELVAPIREGDFPQIWQVPMTAMDVLAQSFRFAGWDRHVYSTL